jgi:hypothetical protein
MEGRGEMILYEDGTYVIEAIVTKNNVSLIGMMGYHDGCGPEATIRIPRKAVRAICAKLLPAADDYYDDRKDGKPL